MSRDWDDFIAKHGVAEYVRVRYLDPLSNRTREPKWYRDDLAENIRRFGPSKYVAGLRKRMTNYVQGGHGYTGPLRPALAEKALPEPSIQGGKGHGARGEPATTSNVFGVHETPRPPEPHRGRTVSLPQKAPRGTEGRPGFDSPRLHPDLDAEEDWRPSHLNLVVEPLVGRLKVPARYRKDESDK